jgi:alanine-synthesizing transaminase
MRSRRCRTGWSARPAGPLTGPASNARSTAARAREFLVEAARAHGLVIVSDEVFADYPLSPAVDRTSFASEARVLTFTLGGLSKSAGLPQVKLAWMVVSGPDAAVRAALDRVAVIADTYLSVSTPVQFATPRFIEAGAGIRQMIGARVRGHLERLRIEVAAHPALTLVQPEGGWSAVLRVPAIGREEDLVLRLLNEAGVLVHPGYFFDFADEAFLVVSLLPTPDVFAEGVSRIGRFMGDNAS